jgi:hypothetical protein
MLKALALVEDDLIAMIKKRLCFAVNRVLACWIVLN